MFNIIFPSTGLLTSVGDQEALVNKVDAACNRNRKKEDQSEESDERLRNEKSSSAAASGASRAAPSKHFYSRLRKAKNGKVETDEFAGKCDATSGKQKRLLSHESFVSVK